MELILNLTFLEYYVNYIQAFGDNIPLAIMTSDDTHELTMKLLQENNNYGLKEN